MHLVILFGKINQVRKWQSEEEFRGRCHELCILVFSIPPPFPPFHPSRSELRRRFTHVDQLSGNMASGNTVFQWFAAFDSGPKTPTQLSEEKVTWGENHGLSLWRRKVLRQPGAVPDYWGETTVSTPTRRSTLPTLEDAEPLRSLPDSCKGSQVDDTSLGTTLTTRSRPFPRRGSLLGSVSTGFLRSVAWVCASSSWKREHKQQEKELSLVKRDLMRGHRVR